MQIIRGLDWGSGNPLVLETECTVSRGSLVRENLRPHAGDHPANSQEAASFSYQVT